MTVDGTTTLRGAEDMEVMTAVHSLRLDRLGGRAYILRLLRLVRSTGLVSLISLVSLIGIIGLVSIKGLTGLKPLNVR